MKYMDNVAACVNLCRGPAETDAELLNRVKCAYRSRAYGMEIGLLRLLSKLQLKSTRWHFSEVP